MIEDALRKKPPPQDDAYQGVVKDMHSLYNHNISEAEAHDAARRMINFTKLLLESDRQQRQDHAHATYRAS